MPNPLAAESTLTDRYQTTVPEAVRRTLGLNKRDKISYLIRPDGEVVLTRAVSDAAVDPAFEPFLNLLALDIARHPEHLKSLDAGLLRHVKALTQAVQVDLDAPLSADDE
jgi:antitoxin PrlF